jgi:D-3-phosphoglycerate dehydrogenase / 2-oxoglutarate reductase
MKDGVMIVNTARGPIICLDDLLSAMDEGKVVAAALDVVEFEPIEDPNHKLHQFDNLVITPHSAYYSVESSEQQHRLAAETVIQVLKGEMPYNIVHDTFND